jgi:hypothetical protein
MDQLKGFTYNLADLFQIPQIFINTDKLNLSIKNKPILNYLMDILPMHSTNIKPMRGRK